MARLTDALQNNATGEILISGLSERIVLSDATAMFQGDYSRAGPDLVIQSPEGSVIRIVDYYSSDQTPDLYSEQGAILTADIVGRLAGTRNPMAYAQSGTPSGQEQIGQVETLEGTAFATRANGQRVALQVGDPVFQDDLVETADDSNLGLTFIDETVFSLSANARMILDELVYEPGGSDNSMVMNLVQGTFVFVTGQVAPTGEMLVETPVATMGIRGTTPIIMIEGTNGNTEFGILKDPDGKIGAYELRDKITGQTIDRVIDEGTILQLDQAGGTPSAITVDAARLAERAEAQSNAYFLHTVARARINAQQQNDNQQNQDGQPTDGADPITTESIGEEGPPESGGLTVDPVVVDGEAGPEENSEDGNEDPNSSGEQSSNGQSGGSSQNIDTNIAPIVTNQTFQFGEDVGIAQGSLAVTDADGPGTLSYEILDQPAFGAVLSNGDGTFTFIADPIFNTLQEGEVTSVSFTYRATDAAGGVSDVGTVTLQILGINDAPIATAINVGSTNEDAGPLFIDLLGTALDPDFGDDLDTQNVTVTSSNPARAAIFAINNETGAFTLDPNQFTDLAVGETETLTIAYTIIDSFGGSTTNTASVIMEGRNDVPVITAVNVVGAVTDIAEDANDPPSANAGDQSAQGSIEFADVDRSDRPIATETTKSVVALAQGGGEIVLTAGQLAAIEDAFTITSLAANTNNGTVNWDYTIPESSLDFLGAGETVTAIFTITIDDTNGGVATQDVTITINVAVDTPVITIGAGDSAAETLTETDGGLVVTDTLTVNDVDLSDTVTASVVSVVASNTTQGLGPDNAALLAMFTVTATPIAADVGDANNIVWTFDSAGEAFNYLDDGESLTLTYTVRATDDELTTDEQTVTVTVTGTNDVPVITVQTGDSAAETLVETDTGLTVSDTLTVNDLDLSDTVTASVVSVTPSGTTTGLGPDNAALLAMFSVTAGSIAANAGDMNNIVWTFDSGNEAFNYLDDGESLTLTYTVRATDDSATTDDQTVTVTITGTNDVPDVTVAAGDSAAETVAETDAGLIVSDTLTVNDPDLSDAVTASVVSVAPSGTTTGLGPDNAALLAMFSVTAGSIAADVGDANNIIWTFDSGSEAFNYLDDGESLTLTYTVRATDDSATTDDQTVAVIITGTNDGPLITVQSGDSAAETLAETDAGLIVSDTLSVNDPDLSDAVTAAPFAVTASGTTTGLGPDNAALLAMFSVTQGSIAANAGDLNNLVWTFDSGSEAFNYLDDGETLTLSYTVRVIDDSAASNDLAVTINVTGTNDGPDISIATGDSAAETLVETDTGLTVSDTLTVNDLDLSDTVTAGVVSVTPSGTTAGLGPDNAALLAMFSVTAGSIAANAGDMNNIVWTFVSGSEAFNYLDDGESLTLTYTVRATDDSATTDDQTVAVTITGTNDGPLITVQSGDSAAETLAETDTGLIVSDTLSVNDPDLSDAVTATPFAVSASGTTTGLGPDNAALLAMFSVTQGSIAANAGDLNNLVWTFDSGSEAFNYLDDGETLTLSYTVRVIDDSAASNDLAVTINVTGTNDVPDITIAAGDSAAETVSETDAGLIVSDTLTVNDPDLSDAVTASVVSVTPSGTTTGLGPDNAALLAMFSVTAGSIAANAGDMNNIVWTFDSGSEAFNYLDDGESLTLTYTVRATDDSATTDDQTVTVTITGTNDVPDITVAAGDSAAETVAETDAGLIVSDKLTVNDLDLSDAVTASVVSVTPSGTTTGLGPDNAALLAMFSVTAGSIAANAGDMNNLVWTFDSGSEAFNYLDDGESLTLTYTVRATDDSATTDDQTVAVTITGTNDGPLITVQSGDSAAETLAEADTGLIVSDTLSVNDSDLSDAVTATPFAVSASGTTTGLGPDNAALLAMFSVTQGSIAANAGETGNIVWSFDSGNEAFDYLDDGETLTLSYTVRVTDDSAASNDLAVTINVTGTNDGPMLDLDADGSTGAAGANYFASFTEGGAAVGIADTDALIKDVDDSDIQSATIKLINPLDGAAESLAVSGTLPTGITATAYNPATGVLMLTGAATLAAYQTALAQIVYSNSSEDPDAANRTIEVTVSDGTAISNTAITTINVVPINDAPETTDASASGDQDAGSISVTLDGSDVDGTVGSFRITSLPTDGTLYSDASLSVEVNLNDTVAATGNTATLFFLPNQGFSGEPIFEFAAIDNQNLEDASPATATITVNAYSGYGYGYGGYGYLHAASGERSINGDGFQEIVVEDPADGDGGNAYVVFGAERVAVDGEALALINLDSGNGDGFADLIVNDPNDAPDGKGYIVYGGTQFAIGIADAATRGDGEVFSLGSVFVGDVNGDGIDDLIIGDAEPGVDSYVVFGAPDGETSGSEAATGDMDLSLAELAPVVEAAITRWAEAGLNDEQISQLEGVTFEVADLGGDLLGRSENGHIIIDDDAAGHGWFIDTTPLEDGEFANALSATHLKAEIGQIPAGQIDLLTSVLHEFGHELGFEHADGPDAASDLLFEELGTGERRLPGDTTVDTSPVVGAQANTPEGPIANDDGLAGEFRINPGGSIDILVSELLANDVDPNGEQFDLTEIFESTGGSASLEQVGSETVVRFTASDSAETGSFQYQVTNESGGVGFAMVDIIIDDMNTAV